MRLIKKIHKKAMQIVTIEDVFSDVVSSENCSTYSFDLQSTRTAIGKPKLSISGTATFVAPVEQANHWAKLIKKSFVSQDMFMITLFSILKNSVLDIVVKNQDNQNVQKLIEYREGQSTKINKSFFLNFFSMEPEDIVVKEQNNQINIEATFYLY
jgi:hypothetical protein